MTSEERPPLAPGLYIVSTPIGNLEDITLRALRILESVDVVFAEDTRVSGRLLKHFGIRNRLMSYHGHNERGRVPQIVGMLKQQQRVALISDAGTPGISDPAHKLVKAAISAELPVIPVPGATAAMTALVASGLPTDRFVFEGFLPRKKGRQTKLQYLSSEPGTIILYENPLRLQKTLQDIVKHFGNRYIVVSRELTKRYEEFIRDYAENLLDNLANYALKGEVVLLVAGKDFKPLETDELNMNKSK